jgi:hypothetical protein
MEIYQDFKEFAELLNARKVEYLVVGAHARAYYGAPRFTRDLDIWINPTVENAQKVVDTLTDFGFESLNYKIEDFTDPDSIIQLGVEPVRIDLVTSITGVTWVQAWQGRQAGKLGTIPVFFLGKQEFIANKRATGRKKDLADLEELGEE